MSATDLTTDPTAETFRLADELGRSMAKNVGRQDCPTQLDTILLRIMHSYGAARDEVERRGETRAP